MPFIIGLAEMNARLLNLIRALPDEIEKALIEDATDTLDMAKSLTPVKTGALRDSGTVHKPVRSGFEVAVPISFGDPTPYYAIYVHENLEAKHPNGGQAKFLETAILYMADGMSVRVGNRIQIERLVK
jgi:hypothetical protein